MTDDAESMHDLALQAAFERMDDSFEFDTYNKRGFELDEREEETLNGMALFAGVGGLELGLRLAVPNFRTVCYVEQNPYCVDVLKGRIKDGCLDDAPIWDDVSTFDGRPWHRVVDIVAGGFPCQDVSVAGKRRGLKGDRSGLWLEFARVVREVRPRYVLVENVPGLRYRRTGFFGRVLGDLAACGYDARWESITAAACGAPHRRDRVFVFAHPGERSEQRREPRRRPGENGQVSAIAGRDGEADGRRCNGRPHDQGQASTERVRAGQGGNDVADADDRGLARPRPGRLGEDARPDGRHDTDGRGSVRHADRTQPGEVAVPPDGPNAQPGRDGWWAAEPNVGRVAHGVPARVDRLKALGNGVVPTMVQMFLEVLGLTKGDQQWPGTRPQKSRTAARSASGGKNSR